jgi:5-methylcytosine-specific restriction endonuclease McrA
MNKRTKADSEKELRDRHKLQVMPYKEFLKTTFWQTVKQNALTKAKHRCQICNTTECLQVHHRTYANRGWEDLHPEELTVLCDGCHSKHHDKLANPKEADKPVKRNTKYTEPHFGGGDVTNCRPMTENELRLFRAYRASQGIPLPEAQKPSDAFNAYWESLEKRQDHKSIEEEEFEIDF